jgi:hypothetical protein
VKLCFDIDKHEPGYIDAYYGPAGLKEEALAEEVLDPTANADVLLAELEAFDPTGLDDLERQRWKWLTRHARAARGRLDVLLGVEMDFDQESALLYDAVCPPMSDSEVEAVLREVEALIPGDGLLPGRIESFRRRFNIPPDKLKPLLEAVVAEARARTARHIDLPAGEDFNVEYVSGQPWRVYNGFKGDARSIIQINTDLPLSLDWALLIGCHEGYPGHHVFHSLRERDLYRGRGWAEASVVPLYTPIALVAEGMANFGVKVAFTAEERLAFEREKLCPLAGLPEDEAATYDRLTELTAKLGYVMVDAARQYFNGEITRSSAVEQMVTRALYPREMAESQMTFAERYRAYIINYVAGEDLVKGYVERRGGMAGEAGKRWGEYARLLTLPVLPGDLRPS